MRSSGPATKRRSSDVGSSRRVSAQRRRVVGAGRGRSSARLCGHGLLVAVDRRRNLRHTVSLVSAPRQDALFCVVSSPLLPAGCSPVASSVVAVSVEVASTSASAGSASSTPSPAASSAGARSSGEIQPRLDACGHNKILRVGARHLGRRQGCRHGEPVPRTCPSCAQPIR